MQIIETERYCGFQQLSRVDTWHCVDWKVGSSEARRRQNSSRLSEHTMPCMTDTM